MKANDVAKHLGIKASTLRKYALLFEANGYLFARDVQNNRVYSQQDLTILTSFIDFRDQHRKLTNDEVLMMLSYDFQPRQVLTHKLIKNEILDEKGAIELEEIKIKVDELDRKIDTLYMTLLNAVDSLEKTIEKIKTEQVTSGGVELSKKKSVWERIKSR